jgi:hypothetical protein
MSGVQQRLGVAAGLLQALEDQVARGLEGAPSKLPAIGLYSGSPAFCLSTTAAMRSKVARTCALVTTPWCSQLAMCWLLMRSVARSSIRPTLWMSGTLEQPTPWSTQRTT